MSFAGDPLALYGQHIVQEHHANLLKQLPTFKADSSAPNPFDVSDDILRFFPHRKVGILGAGIGGLYTALILDSIGVEYEILEASGRAGGRLETYKFPNGQKYDYYEAGAMRFPLPKRDAQGNYKDGIMRRLAELTDYEPLNRGQDRLKDKLIPYYYSARAGSNPGFYYFDCVYKPVSADLNQSIWPFNGQIMGMHDDYIATGADTLNRDVLRPFNKMLANDLVTGGTSGWEVLMEYSSYSLRGYMGSKYMPSENLNLPPRHLPTSVIDWCELLESNAGGYNCALAEQVFCALEFANVSNTDFGDVDWKCFEGGTETLSKRIVEYIKSTGVDIQFKQRATSISQGHMVISLPPGFPKNKLPCGLEQTNSKSIDLVIEGEQAIADLTSGVRFRLPCVSVTVNGTETRNYSHVISTIPLPALRTINLNDAGLNMFQRNALRDLTYGPAIKIAILFKSNWWTTKLSIVGGQSFTDLPLRTIVYPSYGVDSPTPCKVLIASYTWRNDLDRLAALATEDQRETLKELVLCNLAEAHNQLSPGITYEYLKGEFVDMHVKDWSRDPYAMGSSSIPPAILDRRFFLAQAHTRSLNPENSRICMLHSMPPRRTSVCTLRVRAISTRHGWAVGALDSAWRAVYQYLKVTGQDKKIEQFKQIWGENVEWTGGSTLVEGSDLLDQHLGLVNQAVLAGIIKMGVGPALGAGPALGVVGGAGVARTGAILSGIV